MHLPVPSNLLKTLLIYGLLLLGVYLVFGQTAHFAYVEFDDPDYVYQNPFVQSGLTLRGVLWAFTQFHASNWHPLTWISHMLDRQLGLGPGGQHVVNFTLHGISACLLFTLLCRLTAAFWPSAMAAALFAFHPLRVESVAWIAERKDVLGGLFFFLALLAYERYVRRGQTMGRYLLVTFLFMCGLMSKPMLVTLPLVALLLDYWPLGRFCARSTVDETGDNEPKHERGAPAASSASSLALRVTMGEEKTRSASMLFPLVMEKLPWLLLSAGSCAITIFAQGRAVSTLDRLPLGVRAANAIIAYAAYIGQMFWPVRQAVFYPHPWKWPPLWATCGAALLLAIISHVALALPKRRPHLLVGWLWYLGMLVPVIGLVQVGRQAMADRYTYLPEIGLAIALVWTAAAWARSRARRFVAAALAAALLAALLVAARRQTTYWRDNLTLWTRAVACTPENAIALNNLASALLAAGHPDEARADIERAIEVDPDFALGYYNRGRLLARDGHRQAAIAAIKHAVELEPDSPVTQNELALLLFADHRPREAIGYLDHVLKLDPETLVARENLAWFLATTAPADGGDGPRAVALAERICRTLPSPGADEYDVLAAAYAAAGRFGEALSAADRAQRLAAAAGKHDLAEQIGKRRKLYEAKKAYWE